MHWMSPLAHVLVVRMLRFDRGKHDPDDGTQTAQRERAYQVVVGHARAVWRMTEVLAEFAMADDVRQFLAQELAPITDAVKGCLNFRTGDHDRLMKALAGAQP